MAGNRRGRLKEHFEGIHRNFDWILYHIRESLELIKADHPHLSIGIDQLGKAVQALDKLAQEIYHKL